MIYVDITTDYNNEITLINQQKWIDENGIVDVKHTGTKVNHRGNDTKLGFQLTSSQYNRWRFVNETDAMAFKLRWT